MRQISAPSPFVIWYSPTPGQGGVAPDGSAIPAAAMWYVPSYPPTVARTGPELTNRLCPAAAAARMALSVPCAFTRKASSGCSRTTAQ